MSFQVPSNYYGRLAQIESSNNPFAQAGTSSASGLYQFTKGTWEKLGFDWSDRFDVDTQNEAIRVLTQRNASYLDKKGAPVDAGSLYGAHFLGAGTAAGVYTAPGDASIRNYVSAAQISANPSVFKNISTVQDFKDWASGKFKSVGQSILNGVNSDTAKTAARVGAAIATGGTSEVLNAAVSAVTDKDKKDDKGGLLGWLKRLFSVNTASRFVAVAVGIVLIAGAIWALVNSDKVIEQVKQAA